MQPSSTRLALATAGANLVLVLALGVGLLLLTRESGSDTATSPASDPEVIAAPPTTTSRTTRPGTIQTSPSPTATTSTTPTTPAVPAGYQPVSGPGGMTTVVPSGWRSEASTGPGNIQAIDPEDAGRLLKYGGAPEPAEDIYNSHVAYEAQIAKRSGYQLIRLDRVTFHGTDAVDWEFEWSPPEGRRHVRSLYWRDGGYEYFVYAAAPLDKWTDTQQILDNMIDNATP